MEFFRLSLPFLSIFLRSRCVEAQGANGTNGGEGREKPLAFFLKALNPLHPGKCPFA